MRIGGYQHPVCSVEVSIDRQPMARQCQGLLVFAPDHCDHGQAAQRDIVFANSRITELLGRRPQRIGEADIRDLAGRPLSAAESPLGRALRGETVVAEHLVVPATEGRRARTLRIHATPLRDPGGQPARQRSEDSRQHRSCS